MGVNNTGINPNTTNDFIKSGNMESSVPHLLLMPVPPAQLDLFTNEPTTPVILWDDYPGSGTEVFLEEGVSVVQMPDGLSVSISGFGVSVSKKSERLVLKKKDGRAVWQLPFDRLTEIILSSKGISVTTDLLTELSNRGIRCTLLSGTGRPVAQISSPILTGTVATRRAQYEALNNGRGLLLALGMINGKLLNQAHLLKYFSKYYSQANPVLFSEVSKNIHQILTIRKQLLHHLKSSLDISRTAIMGIEGSAARSYWNSVSLLIEQKAEFEARHHRGASDFVNSCLNYGYGVLYSHVWGAVLNAGLEPFAGFLHTDRPGKPSMVLDLTEEFRAPVVDRAVISAINLGQLKQENHTGQLSEDARSVLVSTRIVFVIRITLIPKFNVFSNST